MELDSHQGKTEESDLPYDKRKLREKSTAENVIKKAPYFRGDEKQDEQCIPSPPGTADGSCNQQRYIGNSGN